MEASVPMRDITSLLQKYCTPQTVEILMTHGRMVAGKALEVCGHLDVDAETRALVIEAAYLHDIGVCRTDSPDIGCHGTEPYIRHGIIGREILDSEGLPLHALIAERHTGVGLTVADIVSQKLPLPEREMVPYSLPERIICFADLFFSKNPAKIEVEKSADKIRRTLSRHGSEKVALFDLWLGEFSI